MSAIYDNWKRLVAAVLKKEQFRQLCHADSLPSVGSISSSNYLFSSRTSDIAVGSWIQTPLHQIQRKNRFRFLRFNSDEFEASNFETLIKHKFSIPYRSVVDNGITTVVKKLRGASISASIRHENGAYFSYKNEMLIIYEYESLDGLFFTKSVFLGKSSLLDWESRLRVAICVARAIANTHGEVTSTATSLNSHDEDCFSDLGLEKMAASSVIVPTSSYCAPEVNHSCDLSRESDVYSFGVVLLELLTGKFSMQGNVIDRAQLVKWVTRRFLEAGTLIVYEFVPVRNPKELIEMWKLLLVAIRCVEDDPERRPELSQVVRMMEDIKAVRLKNGN